MKVYFCVIFIFIGLPLVYKVSAEKTGWLCDKAFGEDIPAVYFPDMDIINACLSMRMDEVLSTKRPATGGNEKIRSCTLQPDRQCIASR